MMTTVVDEFNGYVAMLRDAADYCDDFERKKKFRLSKTEETYKLLKEVWPEPNDKKPTLPSYDSCLLANEYYMDLTPTPVHTSEAKYGATILFLAESHCETPPPILGKKLCLDQFHEPLKTRIAALLPTEEFHGHINLVHCLTYGKSWLLNQDDVSTLSMPQQKSVSRGMDQFWRVMAVMAGDCNVTPPDGRSGGMYKNDDNTRGYDPLTEENYKAAFSHVVGGDSGDEARLSQSKLRAKGIVLADVCPVPIYSGVGNSVK
jgi:hypothetical protein